MTDTRKKYWDNSVRITGKFHAISGAGTGRHSGIEYTKFSVLTETLDTRTGFYRPNYVVCRTYEKELKKNINELNEGDIFSIYGEVISSAGSGELFVLVKEIVPPGEKNPGGDKNC